MFPLVSGRPLFIAEVKTSSPHGFQNTHSREELLACACRYGDMLSIHTHSDWGGSYNQLGRVRAEVPFGTLILAKGIHEFDVDVQRALDAKADCVLVVGRVPAEEYRDRCLLEPFRIEEMLTYPADTKVVWNQRDLLTGLPKRETFAEARNAWSGWLCQASLLRTVADVHPDADAVLVGSHLPTFADSFFATYK